MHISEGVLSPVILLGGAALAVAGVGIGLRKLQNDEIPKIGILSAGFFVASLIHIPIGPASIHLVFNGLLGLILGWKAFASILVGLSLQAMLFQYGGFTTLGINTFNMAMPAVICHYLFRNGVKTTNSRKVFIVSAFSCGFFAVLISSVMLGFSLYLTGEAFLQSAKILVMTNLPVMAVDGALTAASASFILKIRPELFEAIHATEANSNKTLR